MKYTKSHEWIQIEDRMGTVGISDIAQNELGEVVYVELPVVGKNVSAGEQIAVLESTKAAVDIYSPVSGKIAAVNETLKNEPQLINHSPEKEGWLFKIVLTSAEELEQLLDAYQYAELYI